MAPVLLFKDKGKIGADERQQYLKGVHVIFTPTPVINGPSMHIYVNKWLEKNLVFIILCNSTSRVAQLPRPSPKLKAMDQIRQSSIKLKFGIPIPSANVNATNFMGHQVPYPNPDLRNLSPNSTFYYPLQILESPLQINLTVYVGGNAGILEGGINNEQFVQVETPQTVNTTIFEAAPVMQLNISQTMVPCIVTLRLRNIINGYSIRSFDVVSSTKK